MAILEKISTLSDMKILMSELKRLKAKFIFDYYGVLQDFSSKKLFPQWLQKKSIKNVLISDKGNEILTKVINSKKMSLVLYDLETPDLNGLQFLSELEKNPDLKAKCKTILVCPKLPPDAQTRILYLGAIALIFKPFTEDDLQRSFEKAGLDY
ncbi:MAG: response regulator [Candidatus Fibromonas sp.]|jgi:CheY-like chemotaxis protein|nr:response regulator [Candidatus Fibromonas sp.]